MCEMMILYLCNDDGMYIWLNVKMKKLEATICIVPVYYMYCTRI